jgi:DNA-binding transcriptional LysR family regulator
MIFKQVEAFRVVMMTRSMTVAASLLHTSQPNVSRWISLLEKKVGFSLFQRRGTKLIPTPEATAFYGDVERAFVGLDSLNDTANSIRRRGTGFLRIGAVGSIEHCVLPNAIHKFSQIFSGISVVISVGSSDVVAKWIATGYCDIGFCQYPADLPGLHYKLIDTAFGVGVVSDSHKLAGREILYPSDFDGENFISMPKGTLFRDAIDRHFRNSSRILLLETPYIMTICALVGKGLGISIVNPVVSRALRISSICEIPFSEKVEFQSYLVTSEHFPVSILASRMADCVQDAFAELESSTG